MRVFVLKAKRLLAPIALITCCAVLIALGAIFPKQVSAQSAFSQKSLTGVETNDQRVKLLESFGLEVENAPREIVQVVIPRKFDQVYDAYNDLQKPLGLDLSPYRGKTVTRFTYAVTNSDEDGTVYANLLVYDSKLVGGDVSSADPNGFARSLTG